MWYPVFSQEKINRINELARKAKTTGLSVQEKEEQQLLRAEYISVFRGNLKSTLDSVVIVDKAGNRTKLKSKDPSHSDN